METRAVPSNKLFELRAKTDRELTSLLHSRLDQAIRFATEQNTNRAEQIYTEVTDLLPWMTHLTRAERVQLNLKLQQLRECLDECQPDGMHLHAACS